MELILFTQNGCKPCKAVENYLNDEDATFTLINVSDSPEVISEYSLMSTPTTVLIDGSEEVARVSGFNPPELDAMISKL